MVMLSSLVLGASVSLTSPEHVAMNESFDVSIDSEVQETRDVKIFVYNGDVQHVVSQIYWGNTWKNARYYLKEVYPQERTFKIRVITFEGASQICVQLRRPNATSYNEHVCNPIEIRTQEIIHEEPVESEENVTEIKKEAPIFEPIASDIVKTEKRTPIQLNEPAPIKENKEDFISPEEQIRSNIIYVFAGICALLVILLAFKLI